MRLIYNHATDHITVEIDPMPNGVPGSGGHAHVFDEAAFRAMMKLADRERPYWERRESPLPLHGYHQGPRTKRTA